jgi:hypothetical protein
METVVEQIKTTSDAENFADFKALRNAPPVETKAAPVEKKEPVEATPKQEKTSPPEPEKGKTAEPAGDSENKDAQDKDKPKRDRTAEGRIAELNARAKAAEEERDRLRRELETHRATKPPAETKPPVTAPPAAAETDKPKPKLADYLAKHETYEAAQEAWEEDVATWRDNKRQRETAKGEEQRRVSAAQENVRGKIVEARKKYADFDEVTAGDAKAETGLILTPPMIQFVVESPLGADVVYHLGKHPEEYARIKALSPTRIAAELGWIERELSAPPSPEKPKTTPVSQAPPPPRTVGGTEPPAQGTTAEARNMSEFKRLRQGGR